MRARNNFLFLANDVINIRAAAPFAFRQDDPKLLTVFGEFTFLAFDSPAIAGGFNPAPFERNRILTGADVGPHWLRR